jgi:predicted AAA+ superfamily ATPase
MKKRLLFYKIKKHINHKNALVITGMRQVGKTTLMKALFDDISSSAKLWFDFDNPLDQKIFENEEYKNIYHILAKQANLKNKKERLYIFIDEIQNFPEITKIIKFLIDHYGIKFIVTGSSAFYLKNLFPESLSGRKFLYHLEPFSFNEFLYFKNKISLQEAKIKNIEDVIKEVHGFVDFKKREIDYNEYLKFGGFPEVVLTKDEETKKDILKNIFSSFFKKDLMLLSDFNDIREIRDLILLLVPRVGSMIDVSRLAEELKTNRPRVYSYLEFLQGVFFIKLLSKFSKSIDRSVAGGRKVYFADTGILNMIGDVNEAQLLENAVVNQFSRYGDLSFYNKRNISEIDIILDKKIGFEIKSTGTRKDQNKIEKIIQSIKIEKAFVVSKNFEKDLKNIIYPHFL